ncbi:hypothetical protein QOT17_015303 [Balamuthia mandrillaris]
MMKKKSLLPRKGSASSASSSPSSSPSTPKRTATITTLDSPAKSRRNLEPQQEKEQEEEQGVVPAPDQDAEEAEEFDKDGFMNVRVGKIDKKKQTTKQGKKWKYLYFNLVGGSLYLYNEQEYQNDEPKHSIQLSQCKLSPEAVDCRPLKWCFRLLSEQHEYTFSAESEQERRDWLAALELNRDKPSRPPIPKEKLSSSTPTKGKRDSHRLSTFKQRTRKNVVEKATFTPMGKKAIRARAPKEITNLIDAVKKIVERETGSTKRANEIEKDIWKIGVKSYLLVSDKRVSLKDLLEADPPLRQSLDLFAKCHHHVVDVLINVNTRRGTIARTLNKEKLEELLQQVQVLVRQAADTFRRVLEPHLQPKSLERIESIVSYLGDPQTLLKILVDVGLSIEVGALVSAGEHYSQFHFYVEEEEKNDPSSSSSSVV